MQQRVRELASVSPLGASRRDIVRLIAGSGIRIALAGILTACTAALLLARDVRCVSGITTSDPLTYLAIVAMLNLLALLTGYLPARRETRVDPMITLRTDYWGRHGDGAVAVSEARRISIWAYRAAANASRCRRAGSSLNARAR